ncbi:YcxB family protein [Longimicrobium sp.]|uniref:YcxB family protein n=1 Tax=Longimicrobium sp. TaxID=2029185 RepID=UPI003B3B3FE9
MSTSSPPAPARELSFELNPTFAEHLRAQKAAQRHGRGRQIRIQQLVGLAIGLPLAVLLLYGRDRRMDGADWLLVALVAGYFLSPLPNILHVRRIRRTAGGPARVTIAESGITASDAHGGNTIAWASVRGVTETDEFLVFDLDDTGGYFVPLRVLREARALEQAREIIARGRAAAAADADLADVNQAPATSPSADVESGPGISLEFATTVWEDFAARQQVWFRSRQGKQFTGYLIGVPVALLALFRWSLGPQGVRDNLYLLIGGATLALVIIPALSLLFLLLGRALARGRMAPVRMRLGEAGLTFTAGGNRMTTAWPGIRKVQRAGGFLLFWIDRNTAHYLPLRALGRDADEARRIIRGHAGDRAAL